MAPRRLEQCLLPRRWRVFQAVDWEEGNAPSSLERKAKPLPSPPPAHPLTAILQILHPAKALLDITLISFCHDANTRAHWGPCEVIFPEFQSPVRLQAPVEVARQPSLPQDRIRDRQQGLSGKGAEPCSAEFWRAEPGLMRLVREGRGNGGEGLPEQSSPEEGRAAKTHISGALETHVKIKIRNQDKDERKCFTHTLCSPPCHPKSSPGCQREPSKSHI